MKAGPKKILYIITKSNFGGAQRYVYELATEMKNAHHEVVVAFGGNGLLKEKLTEQGIRTISIPHLERDVSLGKELHSLLELWRLIKTEHPDVVHLNSSKAGGSGAFIARILGVKNIIFTAHGWPFFEKRGYIWRLATWFFSWCTALLVHRIILVSHHDAHRTWMPRTKHKISVIHTAVPAIDFLDRADARSALIRLGAQPPESDTLWICTVGEYVQNKNLLAAIKAVETVLARHRVTFFYTLIGVDGDEKATLEAYIRDHALSGSVQLLGYVRDARKYLKAYDLFILPSLKEGLPYALLEAGAAGVPCIASNVGGIPEVIEDHKTGVLISPLHVRSIVHALEEYLLDKKEYAQFGRALQEKVHTEFNLSKMLEETTRVYKI